MLPDRLRPLFYWFRSFCCRGCKHSRWHRGTIRIVFQNTRRLFLSDGTWDCFLVRVNIADVYLSSLTYKSYFSSIFAASKTFPQYPGAASGTSMAFFGLSPLFLSLLASRYFTDPTTGLNVTRFLMFLAIASGTTHLIGAFTLRISSRVASQSDNVASGGDEESSINERQPLLPPKPSLSSVQVERADEVSVLHLLRDPYFWSLASIMLVILGSVSFCVATQVLYF
jgi:hypothetical protein